MIPTQIVPSHFDGAFLFSVGVSISEREPPCGRLRWRIPGECLCGQFSFGPWDRTFRNKEKNNVRIRIARHCGSDCFDRVAC
jgi:hypothetical protein